MDESTCDKRVEGKLINFNPLLNMLAANPVTSPAIPPPKQIITSLLLKLFLNNISNILLLSILFTIEEHLNFYFFPV